MSDCHNMGTGVKKSNFTERYSFGRLSLVKGIDSRSVGEDANPGLIQVHWDHIELGMVQKSMTKWKREIHQIGRF